VGRASPLGNLCHALTRRYSSGRQQVGAVHHQLCSRSPLKSDIGREVDFKLPSRIDPGRSYPASHPGGVAPSNRTRGWLRMALNATHEVSAFASRYEDDSGYSHRFNAEAFAARLWQHREAPGGNEGNCQVCFFPAPRTVLPSAPRPPASSSRTRLEPTTSSTALTAVRPPPHQLPPLVQQAREDAGCEALAAAS
jgi:hypothetical protein